MWLCCFTLLFLVVMSSGCATVDNSSSIGTENIDKSLFNEKKIAVFPVQSQKSATTDSVSSLKMTINNLLTDTVQKKFASSTVVTPGDVMDVINEHDGLVMLSKISTAYDSTGYLPKKTIKKLSQLVNSDYLFFSRLKSAKMDLFLAKGFGASLEVFLVDVASNKIITGGIGEFKRGGIYGTGGTDNKEAGTELVRLATAKM